jgi:hypothetical protein
MQIIQLFHQKEHHGKCRFTVPIRVLAKQQQTQKRGVNLIPVICHGLVEVSRPEFNWSFQMLYLLKS